MRSRVDEPPGDEELIAHCLTGQENAWGMLAERLRRLAQRLVAPRQAWSLVETDDLVQNVLVTLLADDYRLLRAYDPRRAQLNTYLAVILRRRAAAEQRKQIREPLLNQLGPDFDLPASGSGAIQAHDTWDLVERTLAPLDVLILRYTAEGYQADEIADLLSRSRGCPFTAAGIRQRRSRARQRLHRLGTSL